MKTARKDRRWLLIWLLGLLALWLWDSAFLNRPALERLETAFLNTVATGLLVILLSLLLGWSAGVALYFFDRRRLLSPVATFVLDLLRSVPQIVGILIGYVVLTILIKEEVLQTTWSQVLWMAAVISLFVFPEVADLVRERIRYYERMDFVSAMLCCGVPESRIINVDILWKNSRSHLVHKMISLFGVTIFLQCSIDFIVSVGLSTDVSLINFPVTLGNQLAKMDSKQDILAIGTVVTSLSDVRSLFFEHLQGISIALIIVFTLLCMYQMSNAYLRRNRL